MHEKVLEFIKTIRESFIGADIVYTEGSCYPFYTILKSVFPGAIAYFDLNHVITKIDGKYYDITGEVTNTGHLPMYKYYKRKHYRSCKAKIAKTDIIC